MANLTGQQICSTYGRLLQIDGGQLQNGLGNPITSLGNFSASYASTAATASYINVTGSGVLVNWFGSQLQLTASAVPSVSSSYALSASLAQTASYFFTSSVTSASLARTASYFFTSSVTSASLAQTASYVNIVGNGVTVNYNGAQIQLTASVGAVEGLQETLTAGSTASGSISLTGHLGVTGSIASTGPIQIGQNWRLIESGVNLLVEKWNGAAWVQTDIFS